MAGGSLSKLSVALVLWKPIDWVLNVVGAVDTVRGNMDPQSVVSRVLFWPYLGFMVSAIGIVLVLALGDKVRRWRASAAELSADANKAITELRDKPITAQDWIQFNREYGRWHARIVDRTKQYRHRYPTEVDLIETDGGTNVHLVQDRLTISKDHAHLRGMIDLRVRRIREFAKVLQEITIWKL